MGRFFSMLMVLAVLLCPAAGGNRMPAHPAFFSMLFPQLIPAWMIEERGMKL